MSACFTSILCSWLDIQVPYCLFTFYSYLWAMFIVILTVSPNTVWLDSPWHLFPLFLFLSKLTLLLFDLQPEGEVFWILSAFVLLKVWRAGFWEVMLAVEIGSASLWSLSSAMSFVVQFHNSLHLGRTVCYPYWGTGNLRFLNSPVLWWTLWNFTFDRGNETQ